MFKKAPPPRSTVGEERDTTAEDLARQVTDESLRPRLDASRVEAASAPRIRARAA